MNSRRRFLLTSALHSPEKFYAALAGRLRKPTATLTGGGVSAAPDYPRWCPTAIRAYQTPSDLAISTANCRDWQHRSCTAP
jgi:hypothetical protein